MWFLLRSIVILVYGIDFELLQMGTARISVASHHRFGSCVSQSQRMPEFVSYCDCVIKWVVLLLAEASKSKILTNNTGENIASQVPAQIYAKIWHQSRQRSRIED